ncbi:hypothetical protein JSQ81_08545 [Sporosarcina sp. Marseille-Q4063]|uniref:hypothetical protein n=1 Tax=Sporosarcina sp. Marseille-Q4063 TaxID=2810514 RepID=UPI001BB08FE6|nr:hypothetical protein [Sporosarcina sp. Marseille-Q4063]QUW23533.1 hypothetical protein JSQ81_08545 [Sporosarcina sp. Marseille-Q4063]
MKMKKGLLMVVLLLALSSIMAAMSYNKASVTSASELKVVNTNQALLSLEANTPWSWQSTVGAKDHTTVVKDGELFIQFGKGINGGTGAAEFYGLQPNSEYQWNPLFTLRNKSAETIKVTVRATGPYADLISFASVNQGQAQSGVFAWGAQGQSLVIDQVTKETKSGMQNIRNIAVKINVPKGHAISQAALMGSIIVESEAVN